MAEDELDPNYVEGLSKVDSLLYNVIFKYLQNGEFPQNNTRDFYFKIYDFTSLYGQKKNESKDLYEYYKKIISTNSIELSKQFKNVPNNEIIDKFIDVCNRMDFIINFMSKAFASIDFNNINHERDKIPNLPTLSLELYKNNIFMPLQSQLTIEVNKLLKEDRAGKREHRIKIKKILTIMKTMDLYNPTVFRQNNNIVWENNAKHIVQEEHKTPIQDFWFNYYIKDVEEFITKKAIQDIQKRSTPEYVSYELEFLDEEKKRQEELINPIFYGRINNVIYEQIIGRNMIELVEMDSGVKNMLENEKYEELSNLYKLFKNLDKSLSEIAKVFTAYIEKRGNDLREDRENSRIPQKIGPLLIKLQKDIDKIVRECFDKNLILQEARNKGFNEFMKRDYYSKQIAFYTDYCLRTGFKGKSKEDVENSLNDIINLLKNLDRKDVFMIESEKKMIDRLINNTSLSFNNEELFVLKLGQENKNLTVKMSTMLSDYNNNKKEIEDYSKCKSNGAPNGIKFNVQVISNSAWDIEDQKNKLSIKLPSLLSTCIDDFEKFYLRKYENKILRWYINTSKLEIQYLYLKNKYLSKSTLPQVLILLELERCGTLSIKQLAQNLSCDISIIKKGIDGLIFNTNFNPKCQNDKGVIYPSNLTSRDFSVTDEFKINLNFVSEKLRFITIPMPKKKTNEEIDDEERMSKKEYETYMNNIIQATITRIMKSKIGQVTTHSHLVNETAKQIYLFTAQPDKIKENIEKLIGKNCIKRDENKSGCYVYVA